MRTPNATSLFEDALPFASSVSDGVNSFATNAPEPPVNSSSSVSVAKEEEAPLCLVSFSRKSRASKNAARAKHSLYTSRSSSRRPAFKSSGSNTPRSSAFRATEGKCMSRHSSAVLTCAAGPTSSSISFSFEKSFSEKSSFTRDGDAPIRFVIAVAVKRRASNAQLSLSVSRSSFAYAKASNVHATASPGAFSDTMACPKTSARWYSSSRSIKQHNARNASVDDSS
mmetsp:Transcript_5074/g.21582  ORF Transcript_5074/g.21582 Transcript_5074/m.21582 type:complete len:226 (+) Transcript_5074:915-1592(+)